MNLNNPELNYIVISGESYGIPFEFNVPEDGDVNAFFLACLQAYKVAGYLNPIAIRVGGSFNQSTDWNEAEEFGIDDEGCFYGKGLSGE